MQPEGTYNMNERTGTLGLVDSKIKSIYGLFIYKKDQPLDLLEGQSPLIFNTGSELSNFLASARGECDILSWLEDDKATVVIRKFNCLIP